MKPFDQTECRNLNCLKQNVAQDFDAATGMRHTELEAELTQKVVMRSEQACLELCAFLGS